MSNNKKYDLESIASILNYSKYPINKNFYDNNINKIAFSKYSNIVPIDLTDKFNNINVYNIIYTYYKDVISNDVHLQDLYNEIIIKYLNDKNLNLPIFESKVNLNILELFLKYENIFTEIYQNPKLKDKYFKNSYTHDILLSWLLYLEAFLYYFNKPKSIYYFKNKNIIKNNTSNEYKSSFNHFMGNTDNKKLYQKCFTNPYGTVEYLFSGGLIQNENLDKIIVALYVDNQDYNEFLLDHINFRYGYCIENIDLDINKIFKEYIDGKIDFDIFIKNLNDIIKCSHYYKDNHQTTDLKKLVEFILSNDKVKLFIDKETVESKNNNSLKKSFCKYFLNNFTKDCLNDKRIVIGDGKEFFNTYWKTNNEFIPKTKLEIENRKKEIGDNVLKILMNTFNVKTRTPVKKVVIENLEKSEEALKKLELIEQESKILMKVLGDEIESSFSQVENTTISFSLLSNNGSIDSSSELIEQGSNIYSIGYQLEVITEESEELEQEIHEE